MAQTIATHKYVTIKDGVVVSVFDGYQLPEYNEQMIEVRDITNKNPRPDHFWTYDAKTNTYTAPYEPPPLTEIEIFEKAKARKADIINEDRSTYLLPPYITYMGHKFNLDPGTYLNLSGIAASVALTGILPTNFAWLDQNSDFIPMNMEQFKGFVTLVFNRMFDGYAISAGRKGKLKIANTLEEVEAV